MSDIEELQTRITAALDRIGQGLDGMSVRADADEADALRKELEDEKLANAQLEQRLKALSQKQKEQAEAEEAAREAQAQAMRKLDTELQSLRMANQQLRDNNKVLREANTAGIAEPHLINTSMLAELEGLRATRAADRAETDLVMANLERLIAGGAPSETSDVEDA